MTPTPAAWTARRKNLPLPAPSAALVAPVAVSLRSSLATASHCQRSNRGIFNPGLLLALAFIIQAGVWEVTHKIHATARH